MELRFIWHDVVIAITDEGPSRTEGTILSCPDSMSRLLGGRCLCDNQILQSVFDPGVYICTAEYWYSEGYYEGLPDCAEESKLIVTEAELVFAYPQELDTETEQLYQEKLSLVA